MNDIIIRIFFSRRAWLLSGRCPICASVLGVLILLAFAFTLTADVETMKVSLASDYLPGQEASNWMIFSSFSLIAITDITIAVTLCIYLFRSRSDVYKGTNWIISTLCRYAISTGLFATLWSVGCLISFALKPKTELTFVFYLPLSKIYINAFLASLNVRESLQEKSRITALPSFNETRLKSIAFASRPSDPSSEICISIASEKNSSNEKVIPIQVQVNVDTERVGDELHTYSAEKIVGIAV